MIRTVQPPLRKASTQTLAGVQEGSVAFKVSAVASEVEQAIPATYSSSSSAVRLAEVVEVVPSEPEVVSDNVHPEETISKLSLPYPSSKRVKVLVGNSTLLRWWIVSPVLGLV